jgi:hypothetical protein
MAERSDGAEKEVSDKMAYLNQSTRGHDSALGAVVAKVGSAVSAMADAWRRARIHRDTYASLTR